jgi:AcrR family transcriptional regulator
MSDPAETPQDMAILSVETVSRMPQQGRSKASLERMLAAARELMIERGNEDFTLQEVSKRGNVSIGSIYLRFESKDNLVRAVLGQALTLLAEAEDMMLGVLSAECTTLADFVPRYVEAYAEVLRSNAPLLRLSMLRAANDPQVAEPGKRTAAFSLDRTIASMLRYAPEFGGSEHELRASSAYHIIFATLARQLSLGSTGESVTNYDWDQLKRELGRMCLAYLTAP